MDKEKVIERKLVEGIKARHGLCIKLLSDYITGLPDRLCLLPKQKVIFVELKSEGEKPRKIQVFIHNKLRALGFRVEVIDTIIKLKLFLKEIDDENI